MTPGLTCQISKIVEEQSVPCTFLEQIRPNLKHDAIGLHFGMALMCRCRRILASAGRSTNATGIV